MEFKIKGTHHIKLTVSNLEKSHAFYEKLPGLKVVANHPNFIMFFNGYFYLGLTDHNQKLNPKKFNEKNIGLDHVSFEVSSRNDLVSAKNFFDKEGIPHGEIEKLSNGLYTLVFRDPDNIQLELCWKGK